jgi:hypothetical protein
MSPIKMAGAGLIVAGVLGLAYGGFTYPRPSHEARVGPFSMTMHDHRTVAVPIWAGIVAVVVGGGLLLVPAAKP